MSLPPNIWGKGGMPVGVLGGGVGWGRIVEGWLDGVMRKYTGCTGCSIENFK